MKLPLQLIITRSIWEKLMYKVLNIPFQIISKCNSNSSIKIAIWTPSFTHNSSICRMHLGICIISSSNSRCLCSNLQAWSKRWMDWINYRNWKIKLSTILHRCIRSKEFSRDRSSYWKRIRTCSITRIIWKIHTLIR